MPLLLHDTLYNDGSESRYIPAPRKPAHGSAGRRRVQKRRVYVPTCAWHCRIIVRHTGRTDCRCTVVHLHESLRGVAPVLARCPKTACSARSLRYTTRCIGRLCAPRFLGPQQATGTSTFVGVGDTGHHVSGALSVRNRWSCRSARLAEKKWRPIECGALGRPLLAAILCPRSTSPHHGSIDGSGPLPRHTRWLTGSRKIRIF